MGSRYFTQNTALLPLPTRPHCPRPYFHVIWIFVCVSIGTVLFFPRESLFLHTFRQKSSEWVKIMLFFFLAFEIEWVSEWGVNISRKKKLFRKKTKTQLKFQNSKIPHIFNWFYVGKFQKIEWVESKLWEEKKSNFFFSRRREKNKQISQIRVCEWATNFSGKKYGTLGVSARIMCTSLVYKLQVQRQIIRRAGRQTQINFSKS